MSRQILLLLLLLLACGAQSRSLHFSRFASVVVSQGRLALVRDALAPGAVARGVFRPTLNQTGWDVLDVDSWLPGNDTGTMYAAGLLEGALTADRILLNLANTEELLFSPDDRQTLRPRVLNFLREQLAWARHFAASGASAVSNHTRLLLAQFDGLVDGFYHAGVNGARDPTPLLLLNAVGDIIDLKQALKDKPTDFSAMSKEEFASFVKSSGHCTALVKVTPGLERLFMGHSSWFGYAATMRIFKHYSLNLTDLHTAARRLSFSSYAGFLESLDDFYVMDSGLVMLQTTNNVFNASLYKLVTPYSLLAWQRVRVANQIARNGSQWAEVINTHNSGTYNNQYMIIDLNKVHVNRSIDTGALTVVEQIPGLVEWSDQTSVLRAGYWPSYNVPFHERIYNLSGYPDTVRQRGVDFSYQMAPRAKIFRRDANRVLTSDDMAAFLRFNEYRTDPYSEGSSCNSICCRGDLLPAGSASPFGCFDSKFTDAESARAMLSFAISGPSTGDAGHRLPPFEWKTFANVSHKGLPAVYDFDWVAMRPLLAAFDSSEAGKMPHPRHSTLRQSPLRV